MGILSYPFISIHILSPESVIIPTTQTLPEVGLEDYFPPKIRDSQCISL